MSHVFECNACGNTMTFLYVEECQDVICEECFSADVEYVGTSGDTEDDES